MNGRKNFVVYNELGRPAWGFKSEAKRRKKLAKRLKRRGE